MNYSGRIYSTQTSISSERTRPHLMHPPLLRLMVPNQGVTQNQVNGEWVLIMSHDGPAVAQRSADEAGNSLQASDLHMNIKASMKQPTADPSAPQPATCSVLCEKGPVLQLDREGRHFTRDGDNNIILCVFVWVCVCLFSYRSELGICATMSLGRLLGATQKAFQWTSWSRAFNS